VLPTRPLIAPVCVKYQILVLHRSEEDLVMPKNTSVIIGDHFAKFIDRQVDEGRYGSASDVVRAGLRLLEEHEMRIEALRVALVEGEQSGASTAFDFDAFINRKRQKNKRGEKAAP
jgi:antitoxin ParD1/3/4